jgi:hypothetical protein
MPGRINKNEMLALVSGGALVLILVIPAFYSIPIWAKIITLLFSGSFLYLLLRFVWIIASPTDTSVSLKPRASAAQAKGLCPVCGRHEQGHKTLTVGYRKPTKLSLRLGGIDPLLLGEGLVDDLHLSVPVCDRCATRFEHISRLGFFAPALLDPSFKVLRRKPGYLRGLRHSFDPSYLKTAL